MTNEELDALQGLCDGATAGEWHTVEVGDNKTPWVVDSHERCVAGGTPGGIGPRANDAAFIAASRTAVPALIAEVRRLTARCEAAEADIRRDEWACKHRDSCDYFSAVTKRRDCGGCDDWEWRGPQPAKEDK